jgi:hypothetical protein
MNIITCDGSFLLDRGQFVRWSQHVGSTQIIFEFICMTDHKDRGNCTSYRADIITLFVIALYFIENLWQTTMKILVR